MGFIYILTNMINGKMYIGQTIEDHPLRRINRHKHKSDCLLIYRSVQKYGWENFAKTYFECPNEYLDDMETKIIAEHKECGIELLNITEGTNKPPSRSGCIPWNKGTKGLLKANIGSFKKGVITNNNKPIILIHPNGFEEFFSSQLDACRKYNLHASGINKVVRGKWLMYKKFKAKYIDNLQIADRKDNN